MSGVSSESRGTRLAEVAKLALRLGATAFGGPAAHIAMLREEAGVKRRWLTGEEFLDLLGATNLIPGASRTLTRTGMRRSPTSVRTSPTCIIGTGMSAHSSQRVCPDCVFARGWHPWLAIRAPGL